MNTNNNKKYHNDRSKCKVCGVELSPENAYKRKDTLNKLHIYCKKHYLEIQKERALRAKTAPYTYTVNRGSQKPFHLYFKTLEEKHEYIRSRFLQESDGRVVASISGSDLRVAGCGPAIGDPEFCDECGGQLRYDERSLLICVDCGLEADVTPFYRESPMPLRKGRHAWSGDSADSLAIDAFYARAYRRG